MELFSGLTLSIFGIIASVSWGVASYLLKSSSAKIRFEEFLINTNINGLLFLPLLVPLLFSYKALLLAVVLSLIYLSAAKSYYLALRNERISIIAPLSTSLSIIFASLLSVMLLKELLTIKKIAAAVLVIISVFLLSQKEKENEGEKEKRGLLFTIATGLLWGFADYFAKFTSSFFSAYQLIGVVGGIFIAYALINKKIERNRDPIRWEKNALIGGILMNLGLIFFILSMKIIGVIASAIILSLDIVIAVLLGIIAGKERITAKESIALFLSFLALIIITS